MPRPQNKDDLLTLSQLNYQKLIDFIESFSKEEQMIEFPEWIRDRNMRDVLIHLHEWHLMMKRWHKDGMSWIKPDMPAKWYTWKTIVELNQKIWEKYQSTNLEESKRLFQQSFLEIRHIIENHTNEELFEKKRYKWTGTTSMWSYLISSTSSHYDWGFKLIKKAKK